MKKITFGLLMTGMIALLLTPTSLFATGHGIGQNQTILERSKTQEKDSLKRSPNSIVGSHRVQKKWTRFNGPKNSLTLSPLDLVLRSIHLSYTRYLFNQRVGIGVEGAYTIKLSGKKEYQDNNFLNINGPTKMMMFMPFSDGSYASAFLKVYIDNRTPLNMFVSVAAFYRNIRYANATVKWEEQASRRGGGGTIKDYHDSLNIDQYQKGLKFLFGVNPVFPMGKVSLDLEGYVGFSLRDVQTTLYHHDYYFIAGNQDPYNYTPGKHQLATNMQEEIHKPNFLQPQAGIKVGLRF